MEIRVAKSAGFCFGVNNAVNLAFKTAEECRNTGSPVCTLGPLIHNNEVIKKLESEGITVCNDIDSLTVKGTNVIVRAHGTTPDVIDKLTEKGMVIRDATCPFVRKIHDIVAREYAKGRKIIIIGDKDHPEIIGINGCCDNSAIIFKSLEECQSLSWEKQDYSCVVQTTFNAEIYGKIRDYLKNTLDNIEIFDNICCATSFRQSETREIAAKSDLMIVIGGRNSSNTLRLYEISRELCENVLLVEQASELDLAYVKNFHSIGVTAGASTPSWIIKEVLFYMDEVNSVENFGELLDAEGGLLSIKTGEIVKAPVVKIDNDKILVDLGFKYEGSIARSEFGSDAEGNPDVAIGDEIEAKVIHVSDKDCEVRLSKSSVDKNKDMEAVKAAFENKTRLPLKIVRASEHGVIANYGTVQIYINAGHLSLGFVKDTSKYVGREVEAIITKFEKDEKTRKMRINASVKEILAAEKKEKDDAFWGSVEEGMTITGAVKSITDFGAFIEIKPGYEGLLHVSEMSWKKIKKPSDVVSIGQEVTARIVSLDRENNRISLSAKNPEDDPWYGADTKYQVGDILDVTVTGFVPYGVFVEVAQGIQALVHISQISRKHIDSAEDVLQKGQTVQAKIISVDLEKKRLGLSIKDVQPYDPAPKAEELDENGNPIVKERKFNKKFSKKKVEGEENTADNGEKAARKPRAPKKDKPEEYQDNVESSDTSIGELFGNLDMKMFENN